MILRCCFIFQFCFCCLQAVAAVACVASVRVVCGVWSRAKCPVSSVWQVATVASVANWLAWAQVNKL